MRAMQKLDELSGCDLHSSVILGSVDDSVFKRLGINVTCEATMRTIISTTNNPSCNIKPLEAVNEVTPKS